MDNPRSKNISFHVLCVLGFDHGFTPEKSNPIRISNHGFTDEKSNPIRISCKLTNKRGEKKLDSTIDKNTSIHEEEEEYTNFGRTICSSVHEHFDEVKIFHPKVSKVQCVNTANINS